MLLILTTAALTLSCAPTKREPAHEKTTAPFALTRPATLPVVADTRPLFERLGGAATVTRVVDDFVALASADPKVNFTRAGQPTAWEPTPTKVALLKKRLVEFIATATGGDLSYNGTDMVTAHRGMNISDAEFDALAADLKSALEKHAVPAREQAELMAVVNRTRSAIVADPAAKKPPAPAVVEPPPPPFVPQPITSDETELDEEPATEAPADLNK